MLVQWSYKYRIIVLLKMMPTLSFKTIKRQIKGGGRQNSNNFQIHECTRKIMCFVEFRTQG